MMPGSPVPRPPNPVETRFFSSTQSAQLKVVHEAIWPAGADNPGANQVGAADYVDLLLGGDPSTYYEIQDWRSLYTAGLAMLDAAARACFGGTTLANLNQSDVVSLLGLLAGGSLTTFPDAKWQVRFFSVLRSHCIEGCLSDPRWGGNNAALMWRWLGYPVGPAANFP